MTSDNTSKPIDLEGTIYDIKYIGEILSHLDMNHDLDSNVLCGIGYLISRTADKAIEELVQGGGS